jgi:protocatechuate 3,4-dioxygenase beta subunit
MFAFAQEPARPADLPAGNFATIEGHVTDASGHPIRKAGLTLRAVGQGGTPLKPPYNAISDAEGKFSFDEITPGGYTLSVERAGYRAQPYR